MAKAIPRRFRADDVREAIRQLDGDDGRRSGRVKRYSLVYRGKRYSSKAVVRLAFLNATGRRLAPKDFDGGEGPGEANFVLRELGFRVEDAHAKRSVPKPKSINKFFTEVLRAKPVNPRWSWGATTSKGNEVILRVWEDTLRASNRTRQISILNKAWEGRSIGLNERKRHVEAIRQGAAGYGVLCTAVDEETEDVRQIAHFDSENLLKFGELTEMDNFIYATIIGSVPVDEFVRRRSTAVTVFQDIETSLSHPDKTQRKTLVNARIGQGVFRTKVLSQWDYSCCVTGSRTVEAIRASHIKPWSDSTNHERLDPENGLPLVATLDSLFDSGLIAFDGRGTMLMSPQLNKAERKLLGTHAGEREVKKALRKTLFKYQLHQDTDLFDRAYGYIREYY